MPISLRTIEPGIAILHVDRPQVRNAMNWQAMQTFAACIEEAHAQLDLRALIVAGSDAFFIAGGDLKELADYPTLLDGERLSSTMSTALNRLEALPCPVIAAMNGPARGGGAEISLACDLRVMSTDADIGLVQVNLGLTPGWGAGQRLLRLVGYSRALEWLVSGRILNAQEAYQVGLANRLTPPGQALPFAVEIARLIAAQPADAVQAIKRILFAGLRLAPELASEFEQTQFPPLWASEAHLQAVRKFLERK